MINRTTISGKIFTIVFALSAAYWPTVGITGTGVNPQNIAINEVFYKGDSSEDWIELINRGSEAVDISGWRWCSRFTYPTIQASQILSGNADLIIEPGEIIALSATIDLNDNEADLGLFVSAPFSNATNMVDFLQWGTSTDTGRPDVALAKNIWLEITPGVYDFIPVSGSTESVSWCGTESGGGMLTTSLDFFNGSQSQGMPNDFLSCDLVFINGFE